MSRLFQRIKSRQNPTANANSLAVWLVAFACLAGTRSAIASGLDVQLKDLRNSFYFIFGAGSGHAEAKAPLLKECIKLTGKEVRKYGRLIHCEPEDDHVMCRLKSGEKLFAYESKEACDTSLKKGIDPTPN